MIESSKPSFSGPQILLTENIIDTEIHLCGDQAVMVIINLINDDVSHSYIIV